MELKQGHFYFISDAFYNIVSDPNLKTNYPTTKRPHFMILEDPESDLVWVAPCTTKVDKFKAIIEKRHSLNKPTDGLRIISVFGKEQVLLLQDSFPILKKYIDSPYVKGSIVGKLADPKIEAEVLSKAKRMIRSFERGIKFTPTSPNVANIKSIMISENNRDRAIQLKSELRQHYGNHKGFEFLSDRTLKSLASIKNDTGNYPPLDEIRKIHSLLGKIIEDNPLSPVSVTEQFNMLDGIITDFKLSKLSALQKSTHHELELSHEPSGA